MGSPVKLFIRLEAGNLRYIVSEMGIYISNYHLQNHSILSPFATLLR